MEGLICRENRLRVFIYPDEIEQLIEQSYYDGNAIHLDGKKRHLRLMLADNLQAAARSQVRNAIHVPVTSECLETVSNDYHCTYELTDHEISHVTMVKQVHAPVGTNIYRPNESLGSLSFTKPIYHPRPPRPNN
jgi:hypothetical protein